MPQESAIMTKTVKFDWQKKLLEKKKANAEKSQSKPKVSWFSETPGMFVLIGSSTHFN